MLAVAPFLLLAPGLPQSHELRYYLALLILPAITAIGWWRKHGSKRWIEVALLGFLSLSLLLNFTQPLYSTAKGLARGEGLLYALRYPSRDLPSAQGCLRQGRRLAGPIETVELPLGMAFACRLQLPANIRITEGSAVEPLPASDHLPLTPQQRKLR